MFILYNIFAVFTKIISPSISFYRKQEFECTFLFIAPEEPEDEEEADDNSKVGGLSTNIIIIIIASVVGAVFCVVIIVVAIVFCNRRDYGERGKRP